MGSAVSSIPNMIYTAGDMRRAAKTAPSPEHAAKLQSIATNMENHALAKAGITNPRIGKLLDTFA